MENQNTPLWDASLDINERLDWLLEALNLDEKCRMFSTLTPEVARLGIRSTYPVSYTHLGCSASGSWNL